MMIIKHEFSAIFALGANFYSQGQATKAQIIFKGLMALDEKNEQASIAYGESLLLGQETRKAWHHFFKARKYFKSEKIEAGFKKASLLLGKKIISEN